jgi:hypothetical protein
MTENTATPEELVGTNIPSLLVRPLDCSVSHKLGCYIKPPKKNLGKADKFALDSRMVSGLLLSLLI